MKKIEGERPFGDIKNFRKNQKMRFLNGVTVSKNVKGDPLGFFNIHSVATY